jgi:hypothetical protein
MANIYNFERVKAMFLKKNVSLDYYKTLVFPVIDISDKGSIHLIFVDTFTNLITSYRSANSGLKERPSQ